MSQNLRLMTVGLIAFLLVSVVTTGTTIYYSQQYTEYYQKFLSAQQSYTLLRGSVIQVNVTIDYQNGSYVIHDAVYLALNTTVLDALNAVADVNATYWVAYNSFLIDAINNVYSNENDNNRWWVYAVNGEHAYISAEQYTLEDGDQIEWTYQKY